MKLPYPSIRAKLKEAEHNSRSTYSASIANIGVHFEIIQELTEWLVEEGLLTDNVSLDYDNTRISIEFKYSQEDDNWKKIYTLLRSKGYKVRERKPEDLSFTFMKELSEWIGEWNRWDYEQGRIQLSAEFPDTCVVEKIGEEPVTTMKAIYRRNCGEAGSFDPKTVVEPPEPITVEEYAETISAADLNDPNDIPF